MSLYTMKLSDSVDTMEFNLLEVPIQDKDIEGAVDNVVLSGDIYTDFLWLKKRFTHKWSILCKDEYERLRGFYTRQFSNAEVPIYQLLDAPSPVEESAGSGEYIQITTTDSTAKLASVEMLGNAEQTTYSGKNKMPMASADMTEERQANFSMSLPAGTYTVSFNLDSFALGTNTSFPLAMSINGAGGSQLADVRLLAITSSTTLGRYSATFTLTTDATADAPDNVRIGLTYWNNGARAKISNIQIENGSTATAYEPYVGGTPAPNPDYPQPISVVTGENVVKIEGKNLFNQGQYTGGTNYGITTTFATEQIKVAGTTDGTHYPTHIMYADGSTTQAQWWATAGAIDTSKGQLTESGTYTLSIEADGNISGHANGFEFIIGYMDGTTSGNQFVDQTTKKGSFTATKPINYIAFGFRPSLTYDTTFTIQLEKGSSASQFEPYQAQGYEVNLGKNLLDNKATTRTYLGVTLTKNNDGSITLNGTSTGNAQFYLDVNGVGFQGRNSHLGAGTYTLNGRDSGGVKFEINYKSTNGGVLYSHGTFTVAEPFDYGIYVTVTNGTTVSNLTIYPQLELGSTATSYAPYFTPIELAKIGNYQDRIYKDSGKWYIEKQVGKVVIDGTETGLAMYATNKFRIPVADIILQTSGAPVTMSNYFVGSSYTAVSAGSADNIMSGYYGAHQIRLHSTKWASLADFTTWLSTHPTTVYYVLATPTTAEITNEALIAQLDALESASLYLGVNNIGTETQNAVPTLALTYFPYYPHEIISPKAVRMELTDGGIINACECRENVQITLRGTIQ